MIRATSEAHAIELSSQGHQALFTFSAHAGYTLGMIFDLDAPRLHKTCNLLHCRRPIINLLEDSQHVKLPTDKLTHRAILLAQGQLIPHKKKRRRHRSISPGGYADISCLTDPEIAG